MAVVRRRPAKVPYRDNTGGLGWLDKSANGFIGCDSRQVQGAEVLAIGVESVFSGSW